MPEYNLRGRVISMYHTIRRFAEEINWSTRKAYDIINGKQIMTSNDIDEMCKVLNVQVPEEMRILFFSK